jgi:hypothetical protein
MCQPAIANTRGRKWKIAATENELKEEKSLVTDLLAK